MNVGATNPSGPLRPAGTPGSFSLAKTPGGQTDGPLLPADVAVLGSTPLPAAELPAGTVPVPDAVPGSPIAPPPPPAAPPVVLTPDFELPGAALTSSTATYSSTDHGNRQTIGWAGQPALEVPINQTHRRQIQLGMDAMDRIAPGFRARFEQLLHPDGDPALKAALDAVTQEHSDLLVQHGKLLALPEGKLKPHELRQREQVNARLQTLTKSYEELEKKLHRKQEENVGHACELASTFLHRMRQGRQVSDVSGQVKVEPNAVAQLEKQKIKQETFLGWVNQFHHQTGLPAPRQLRFRYTEKRPNYNSQADAVNIGEKFSRRLAMHEIAHRLEYRHPEISLANKSWVAARCRKGGFSDEPKPLQELVPKGDYGPDEKALEDSFIDPYVGKLYPDLATEVLSTGLEHMADEQLFVQLYRRDPEHLFLTLGALQTLNAGRW